MATIIVFQHSPHGGPGRLGLTLRDHGFRLDVRRPDLHRERGKGVPPDYDNVHGLVVLGGPQNVGDPEPWLNESMAYIRGAHERSLPIVGVCLGHQLIAAALGGQVGPMPTPELGFTRTSVTVAGQTDTIMAGVPWDFMAFQTHGQQVTAPPAGATVLASSEACKVQAFRVGLRTYGFQFHFESDRPNVSTLLRSSEAWAREQGLSLKTLESQADDHYQRAALVADRLCLNIAAYCFPSVGLVAV
ncbi:MAG: type 1 glutamine amidotransferase [Phycisphaerales bacterium]|nr:type 1 glutamine amidotransferase [Phycisphaerales bacterium]MCB9841013.1 type 1 glutamine amidotransferase [Phycisphaeraceae bacterium]